MAAHVKKLRVGKFRGVSALELEELGDINILLGDNNSGKTSVLEALRVLSRPANIANLAAVAAARRGRNNRNNPDLVGYIFVKTDEGYSISLSARVGEDDVNTEITGELREKSGPDSEHGRKDKTFDGLIKYSKNGELRKIRFSLGEKGSAPGGIEGKGLFTCAYIPAAPRVYEGCVELFPGVAASGAKEDFLRILKIFDPEISDVKLCGDDIWLDVADRGSLPLYTSGIGMQKALLLALAITAAKGGVALIDEIETAIYANALDKIFEFVIKSCLDLDVQLFATMHSMEALDKILYACKRAGGLGKLRIITLKKKKDGTVSRILTGEKALELRKNFETELR